MSTLQKCGPYEPGTLTLVAIDDGTHFSYRPPGKPPPRLPNPGERVRMRWTTGAGEVPCGEGLIVSIYDTEHSGPVCMVLWALEPVRSYRSISMTGFELQHEESPKMFPIK